jgi:hypothetical protein
MKVLLKQSMALMILLSWTVKLLLFRIYGYGCPMPFISQAGYLGVAMRFL